MSLDQGLSNLTLYDAKKYFRKAQNVVFNYTDTEARVREATNNEPWGASSTLMEQIAQGTYNYPEREEVLGMIFRRFTEKRASEWRQIYKALQLLEYLVLHGAERFIDDVRANLSLVKMLETFHYIDTQGRDQGINVRNRTLELVKLLEDDYKIRSGRKKARETAKKYKGVAGGTPSSFLPPSAVNRTAGYGKSTTRGISVSADFDSDDEQDNRDDTYSGGFKDRSPLATAASSKDALTGNDTNHDGIDDEDNDDDFADFQSAAPVTQPIESNSQAIVDIFSTSPSQATTHGSDDFASFATNTNFRSSNAPSEPVPAVTQKKVDPFGSLFNNAKSAKEAPRPPQSSKSSQQNAPAAPKEDDDEAFGEMETAAPAVAETATPSAVKPAQNGQEIDLLSF
ncbi:LAME_0A04258g1_1 [Lachancea meyersii CBS 8951]|uniref:LAME_0A04258g1_1 n=1 Tax=Lachancea meyersii CBS 8951 TaxID=1266667 RepID=A0A1G4INV0_9SACH|nr:LAME_0A04258g1_1 [Lachancea meyersii CBS 8951]